MEHKPHVGTDKLRAMVTGISKQILAYGGQIMYEAHVTDFITNNNAVTGGTANGEKIAAGAVVWPCGHSARDTIKCLRRKVLVLPVNLLLLACVLSILKN